MEDMCVECHEDYPMGELRDGMCQDCRSNFDGLDLEEQLDKMLE